MRGSKYVGLALARYFRACADGTLSGLLIGRDVIGCRPACEHCAAALERRQGSRWKVVRRPTDNIHYPLKLPRCEFGHNLVNGAGFADQQHRRRNRFRYFLFGRPFCPRRIERDAISIAHNRTYPGWPVQRATKSPARRGPRQDRGSYPRHTPLVARRDERGVRLFSPEASTTASPSTSVSPETARLSSSTPARS